MISSRTRARLLTLPQRTRSARLRLEVERLEERNAPAGHTLAPAAPNAIVAADFNADGVPDRARIDRSDGVVVLLGQANGTYQRAGRLAVGAVPSAIVSADFNGDGIADLATANKGSRDVSVLLGNGDGTFQEQQRFPIGGTGPDALFVGDYNGDGIPDLAAVALESHAVSVLLGNGDGTFQTPALDAVPEPGLDPGLPPIAGSDSAGLLLDSGDGPGLPQTFSSGSQALATVLGLSRTDDGPADGMPGAGPELSVLLSAFGIPVLLPGMEAPRPPLADVFVVNGPGFAAGMDMLAQPGGPEGGSSAQGTSVALPEERAVGSAATDEAAVNSFRRIVQDVFRPGHLDGLPGRSEAAQPDAGPPAAPKADDQEAAAPAQISESEPHLATVLPETTAAQGESPAEAAVVAVAAVGLGLGAWKIEKRPLL
jgi:hypothetical protein